MQSPFPGMDPYLEHPTLWPDVHNRLLVALADSLMARLAPNYFVGVQSRTYAVRGEDLVLLGIPEVAVSIQQTPAHLSPLPLAAVDVVEVEVPMVEEVEETFLEVRSVKQQYVVTVIELLSPTNKAGLGRDEYRAKREAVFRTRTNLVEIDLLRMGEPLEVSKRIASDYRILVSRGSRHPRAQLYPFSVRQPIPAFYLPILPGDTEPLVELTPILHSLYQRARYDMAVDYTQSAVPPLKAEDVDWADGLIQQWQAAQGK